MRVTAQSLPLLWSGGVVCFGRLLRLVSLSVVAQPMCLRRCNYGEGLPSAIVEELHTKKAKLARLAIVIND
jgi:hypothetical protein